MIVSSGVSVLVGLATGISLVIHYWANKTSMPKLEDVIIVSIGGIGAFSGVQVGIEMFGHDLTSEQLAVIEMGCLSLVYVSVNEVYKRF